jgi:hypothetical protein
MLPWLREKHAALAASLHAMDLRRVLIRVRDAFAAASIDHALIGGLALAAQGVVRATQDVDFLVDGDSADAVHALMTDLGYRALHRSKNAANYESDNAEAGRVDFLFARRRYARAMLERAVERPLLGNSAIRVLDPADLIGLKVQSSANDPRRKRRDLEDIARLLERSWAVDLERVREYFRLFDREAELDALLAELGR